MKFQYVGEKADGERAFKEKTGIEWMPGSEHDVADVSVCEEMLRHPTVWQPVGTVTLSAAKPQPLRSSGPATDEEVDEEIDAKAKALAAVPAETIATLNEGAAAIAQVAGIEVTDPLAGMDDAAVKAVVKAQKLKIQGYALAKGDKLRAMVHAALAAIPAPK